MTWHGTALPILHRSVTGPDTWMLDIPVCLLHVDNIREIFIYPPTNSRARLDNRTASLLSASVNNLTPLDITTYFCSTTVPDHGCHLQRRGINNGMFVTSYQYRFVVDRREQPHFFRFISFASSVLFFFLARMEGAYMLALLRRYCRRIADSRLGASFVHVSYPTLKLSLGLDAMPLIKM